MPDDQSLSGRVEFVRELRSDFDYYAPRILRVKPKAGGVMVPFKPNLVQRFINGGLDAQLQRTGRVRALILKSRQQGCSTLIEGRFYRKVTLWRGMRAMILTHEDKATTNLFGMAKGFYDNSPPEFRPIADTKNANTMEFHGLGGGYGVATAGSKNVGRSQTAQLFHGSEVGFWPNAEDHMAGIGQIVPDAAGTEMVLESTGNGIGNPFHTRWQVAEAGLSEYIAIFCPWFWTDEYRKAVPDGFTFEPEDREYQVLYGLNDEQLFFRRNKIDSDFSGDDNLFKQEYPANAVEAFISATDTFIPGAYVLRARKAVDVAPNETLIIGVDPKRFGEDRYGIAWRCGRVVKKVTGSSAKITTMEAAGMLAKIIDDDKPAAMFIDIVGLGAGTFDRLIELGYAGTVIPVQGGGKADEDKKYINKRAEMAARKKAWFEDFPNKIPDDDELHADILAPGYKYDSNQRLKIETKEDMRKRGVRSPDLGDAIDLTFAYPVAPVLRGDETNRLPEQRVPWQLQ